MAFLLTNDIDKIKNQYIPLPIWETIYKYIDEDRINNLLIVVPTSKLRRYYTMEIIKYYAQKYNKPISRLNVISLEKLIVKTANYLIDKSSKNKPLYKLIGEGFALSLFEEAFHKAKLNYFNSANIAPSLLNKLFSVITGLRKDGITSQNMIEEYEESLNSDIGKSQLSKMADMSQIMKSYEEILSNKYIDKSGLLNIVLKLLNEGNINFSLSDIYPEINLVLFNDFSNFREPEALLLSYLSKQELKIAVHIDFSSIDGPLLGGYETAIISLAKKGYKINEVKPELENEHTKFIRNNLFKYSGFANKSNLFNDSISIISTKNKLDEVRFIGKLIKYLNVKENVDLKDIAVCFRNSSEYANLFREVFYQYNIPNNITDRISLNTSPLIIGIFALFDIITNKFKIIDIKRAFNIDYFKEIGDNDKQIDLDNLVKITSQLRLSNGYLYFKDFDSWINLFTSSLENKENILNKLIQDSDEDSDLEIINLEKEIRNIKKTISDLKSINDLLKINAKLTADEFVNWIQINILEKFNIYNKIINKYELISNNFAKRTTSENIMHFENIERESRAFYTFILLLEEFRTIYKEKASNKKIKIIDLIEYLKTAVNGRKFQLREKTNYGVTITSIEQIRGIPFKTTILCGMTNNQFPLKYRSEVFLGKENPDAEIKHNISEKMQFYQFLMNNNQEYGKGKKIFLTYPELEENDKLIRSSYIDYLLNITDLSEQSKVYSTMDKSKNHDSIINDIDAINASLLEISELSDENILNLPSKLQLAIKHANEFSKNNTYFENNIVSNKFSQTINNLDKLPKDISSFIATYKDKIYSPTELDNYASCGYQYFLKRILKLQTAEEIEIGLSNLEIGNIVHNILYKFYTEIQTIQFDEKNIIARNKNNPDKTISLVMLEQEEKQFYLDTLKRIANEIFSTFKYTHPLFDIDLELIVGNSKMKGFIEIWLEKEFEKIILFDSWRNCHPGLFEEEFGDYHSDSRKKYIKLDNGFKIKGKIDRIEFIKEDNNDIYFVIADYKRNAKNQPKINNIKSGESFQIPLYLLATEKHLKNNYDFGDVNISPIAGVYYSYEKFSAPTANNPSVGIISFADINSQFGTKYNSVENIATFLNETLEQAMLISNKISDGEFTLSDKGKNSPPCSYCKFSTICRINDNITNFENPIDTDEID